MSATSSPESRVADLMAQARTAGVDRLDAQLLLAQRLQRPRSWLIAHDEAAVEPQVARRLREDFAQRASGVPLAYLTGRKEFRGLSLHVTPDVLVPRPDSETLADWAIELASALLAAPAAVDLGTGSGALALALKAACPHTRVLATDNSGAALRVARLNARELALDVAFDEGDWWAAVGGLRFDVALSNPPYIAAGDPHLAALRHEPRLALVAGADGLTAIRAITAGASDHLNPGGWLLIEHGAEQQAAVAALLGERGFTSIESRRDLAGLPRCTGGRRDSG